MKRIIIILLCMAIMTSCVSKSQLINVANVSQKSEFIINHSDTTKNIFSIHLAIKGEINGNALINIKDGIDYVREYQINKGKVDFNIDTDWYNTKCIINYNPQNVTNGSLVIEYKFYEQ